MAVEVGAATSAPLVIHPGFVKTATSTLQKHVFARHPGIHFLGLPAPLPELEWAIRHICQADSVDYDPARLCGVIGESLASAPTGAVPLISYENLALHESKDKGLVADRLAALFPAARILFTIRRQEDLVLSWYLTKLRVRIKRKAYIPFEEWYWLETREPWNSILDDLRYGRTIGHYAARFGAERIMVLPFELLVHEPHVFAERAAGFIGVDSRLFSEFLAGKRENSAMSRRYLFFWKHFSHLLPRRLVRKWARRMPMHEGARAQIEMPQRIRDHIGAMVAEDNAVLAARFGVDLAVWGYSLTQPSPVLPIAGGDLAALHLPAERSL
jgi:hypothetical protein